MSKKNYEERIEKIISEKGDSEDTRALDFLKSLRAGLDRFGSLTEKQVRALEKIERLSTPEAKKEAEEWIREYPVKFKKDAVVCAKYYMANPPFFSELSDQILKNPSFVPTKSQFKAFATNPYTRKLLEEYHREPKYGKGDLVQIRDTATTPFYLSSVKKVPCVVIDNKNDFLTTHAKGAKTYKLLPIGKKVSILCQERWIKNFRNKKSK
jgi:hypothetical protein